jgi:hypothetical protein
MVVNVTLALGLAVIAAAYLLAWGLSPVLWLIADRIA